MKTTLLEKITRRLNHRPLSLAAALAVCTAAAALGIRWIPFEGMLDTMLPEGSEALRTVSFLREANFADKIAVSVETDPETVDRPALIREMERLSDRFEQSPLIAGRVSVPGAGKMMDNIFFFLDHAGELLDDDDMEILRSRISRDEINRLMRMWYGRLARPEGSLMVEMLRRDPLDISSQILSRIDRLSRSFGYRAVIEDGHFLHPDRRHGLLLFETRVPVTDAAGSRELVDFSESAVADMPPGFSAGIIAGHRRSVSNEKILRGDINRTVIIASIGFIVLFLCIFRDPRAILLFLLPGVSVLFSLNLSALLLGNISYIVIGFGAVLAGIAVDYGIQIYVSMRHSREPYQAVRRILKPVIIGALTTLCVFAAFLASAIPGYRQLGVFALISITLSVIAAVVILPAFLKTGHVAPESGVHMAGRAGNKGSVAVAALFLLSLPVCAVLARRLELETSIEQLDGTEDHILESEREFQLLWSGEDRGQAIAVVTGASYEEAAVRNDRLYEAVSSQFNDEKFTSMAALWPSSATRRRNLERWNRFWTSERVARTRQYLHDAGEEYGFAGDAFEPFFSAIEKQDSVSSRPEQNMIFSQFEERFVQQYADGYRFMSFFPDTERANALVSEAVEETPNAFIASPAALGAALSDAISSEVLHVSAIALALILAVISLLIRHFRLSVAALLPAASGVMWLFAIMAISGLALDIANLVAGIVVVGLCIDYGVFTVHGWKSERQVMLSIRRAITLSALTTLLGAGVLIFAKHPALFSIGLTLVIGVSAGFLAAVFAVPGMCMLMRVPRAEEHRESKRRIQRPAPGGPQQ